MLQLIRINHVIFDYYYKIEGSKEGKPYTRQFIKIFYTS